MQKLSDLSHQVSTTSMYRVLIVHKNASDFVVTNETGTNRLCLSAEEFQVFLSTYADTVEELTENRISPLDLGQFPQLKSLSYIDMTIPNEHLNLVAVHCPNLQNLRLCCFSQEDRGLLEIGKNCHISTLMKLNNLRSFRLDNDEYIKMKYEDFRKLVSSLNIERLKLRVTLVPGEGVPDNVDTPSVHIQLKELDIAAPFEARAWSLNFTSYLSIFENINSLTIKITDTVTEDTVKTMATACRQLEKLHILYTTFGNIQTYTLPPKVTEFTLFHCRGSLTVANIKQLLTTKQLIKFSCRNTDFDGTFEDFPISPTIKSLDLDGIPTNEFKQAYDGNKTLRELTWYHALYNDYREIVTGVPLATCLNLETLNMREGQMALEIVMQLKSLRQLIMTHPVPFLNWSYIVTLLQHSSLAELTIGDPLAGDCGNMTADMPVEGFPTKVVNLKIPLDIFEMALDFWLDLFERNVNMKLVCCTFRPYQMEFLKKLLNHPHFPKSLDTIDVCCFTINCNDMRENFVVTADKLKYSTENHLPYEYTDDVFRIILYRN